MTAVAGCEVKSIGKGLSSLGKPKAGRQGFLEMGPPDLWRLRLPLRNHGLKGGHGLAPGGSRLLLFVAFRSNDRGTPRHEAVASRNVYGRTNDRESPRRKAVAIY